MHPAPLEPPASWAPPWEARSFLESTPSSSTRFPSGAVLTLRGLLLPSVLTLFCPLRTGARGLCPGAARVPLAPPLRSGARLRGRRPCCPQDASSSGLPSGTSGLAPRSLPPRWDSGPSALLPPGPCSSNCSWLLSRSPCQNWASVYWARFSPNLTRRHEGSLFPDLDPTFSP